MSAETLATKFHALLDHPKIAIELTEARLARARAESKDLTRAGLLAAIVRDTAEELEGEIDMEVNTLLDRARLRGAKLPYRFDGTVTRAFAYAVPVLAAAQLWKRDLSDKKRLPEVVHLIARTAVWLLGRSPLPEFPTLGRGAIVDVRSPEALEGACRIAALWLSRIAMARAIPSSFGSILARGLDYFGMWACSAVADRYYDDMQLSMEESMEVAREALDFKLALVTALVRTARADGRFCFEEEEMLRMFLDHLAFSEGEKDVCLRQATAGTRPPSTDVLRAVKHPAHKEFILARAVEMAFADRHETRPEKAMIRQLAKTLGVGESLVRQQESAMRALNRAISGEA